MIIPTYPLQNSIQGTPFPVNFLSSARALLRFMGTRLYPVFHSHSAEAEFLGIDEWDSVYRRFEIYQRSLYAASESEDQGMSIWESRKSDPELAEVDDLHTWGFGRVHPDAIPFDREHCCGHVALEHPAAWRLLATAGNYQGLEGYGFADISQALARLKACGCTRLVWV